MTGDLIRRENLDTFTHREDNARRLREEMTVDKLSREDEDRSSPKAPRTNPADALILDFQLPELGESSFLLCKPPNLCYSSPRKLIKTPQRHWSICRRTEEVDSDVGFSLGIGLYCQQKWSVFQITCFPEGKKLLKWHHKCERTEKRKRERLSPEPLLSMIL